MALSLRILNVGISGEVGGGDDDFMGLAVILGSRRYYCS